MYNQQLEAQGGEAPRSTPKFEGIEEEVSSPWGSIALILLILVILGAGIFTAYRYFRGSAPADSEIALRPTPTPEASPTPASTATPASSPNASPTASPAASPSPTASVAPGPADGIRLQLQAKGGEVWISVKPDAAKNEQALLKPGESREFVATDKFTLTIGNLPAAGMKINGRDARFPNQGNSTVAKNVVITKENLPTFIQ
jgi:hypothetical protein